MVWLLRPKPYCKSQTLLGRPHLPTVISKLIQQRLNSRVQRTVQQAATFVNLVTSVPGGKRWVLGYGDSPLANSQCWHPQRNLWPPPPVPRKAESDSRPSGTFSQQRPGIQIKIWGPLPNPAAIKSSQMRILWSSLRPRSCSYRESRWKDDGGGGGFTKHIYLLWSRPLNITNRTTMGQVQSAPCSGTDWRPSEDYWSGKESRPIPQLLMPNRVFHLLN